ncbi:MAG: ATP-binding protein [Anaerolineales bacterium]|nr:ATP-binding protein [Anaerolineales bacterium]
MKTSSRAKTSTHTFSESSVESIVQQTPLKLTLPALFENLDVVRQFVAGQAETCGLDPEAVYSVQLAVDEAFSNIIEHAYGGECQEKIECTTQITEQGLVIIIKDCGKPFKPEDIPDPDLDSPLEERQVGGLGLYFIRQLMDEVVFTFAQPGNQHSCNIVRMVKRKE